MIGLFGYRLDVEKCFSLLALLFYSELLAFQSLFALSEGEGPLLSPQTVYNPIEPVLRLLQHGVFLATLLLIVLRWK